MHVNINSFTGPLIIGAFEKRPPVSSKNRNGWRLQHIFFPTVEELKNCSKNENNAKSTGFWFSFWKNWCVDREITDEIENYEPAELNTLLEHFYAEVNNTKKVEIMNQKAFNDGIAW